VIRSPKRRTSFRKPAVPFLDGEFFCNLPSYMRMPVSTPVKVGMDVHGISGFL